jgi:hypothetical protein
MTVEKLGYNYYHIYDIVFGQFVSHTYLYYTKAQALKQFKQKYGNRQRIQRYVNEINK